MFIETLFLILGYLPLTLLCFSDLSSILSNYLFFLLIPLVKLYKLITPYPFYLDLISIVCNLGIFLIPSLIYNCNNLKNSKILELFLKFLNNFYTLFIFLGYEYIYRFQDLSTTIFGITILSISYLYFPILHRIYFGHNKNSWKKKINFYFKYLKENYSLFFMIENLEGILLGITSILYYNNNFDKNIYLVSGIIKLLFHLVKPLNLTNKNYYYINILGIITSIVLEYLINILNLDFYIYFINIGLNLIINYIILLLNKPIKQRERLPTSISIPNLEDLDIKI